MILMKVSIVSNILNDLSLISSMEVTPFSLKLAGKRMTNSPSSALDPWDSPVPSSQLATLSMKTITLERVTISES